MSMTHGETHHESFEPPQSQSQTQTQTSSRHETHHEQLHRKPTANIASCPNPSQTKSLSPFEPSTPSLRSATAMGFFDQTFVTRGRGL